MSRLKMHGEHVTLRDFIAGLRRRGRSCTLLGVGPVSETVIRAAFAAFARHRCPAIFIASRNQVDLPELGRGYLMGGTDQHGFVELLRSFGREAGYHGRVYICRDHGGPWQRDSELAAKLAADPAMDIARKSFRADIEAGFNYLHIDPTKCPHPHEREDLVRWTFELLSYCESARRELGAPPIDYEVGAEDIRGGLTDPASFEWFLDRLVRSLGQAGLPLPTCIVGQTGTLCRLDINAGRFDASGAELLARIAARHGIGFKEHNADYLSAASCRVHPKLGVTGMNVAPEFGLVETDALLFLAGLEAKLVREGWLPQCESSGLRELTLEQTFAAAPWRKWMSEEIRQAPAEKARDDAALRLLIARVCGHYVYSDPAFKAAREKLYANLDRFDMMEAPCSSAADFVTRRLTDAIGFYIRHLALEGINDPPC